MLLLVEGCYVVRHALLVLRVVHTLLFKRNARSRHHKILHGVFSSCKLRMLIEARILSKFLLLVNFLSMISSKHRMSSTLRLGHSCLSSPVNQRLFLRRARLCLFISSSFLNVINFISICRLISTRATH